MAQRIEDLAGGGGIQPDRSNELAVLYRLTDRLYRARDIDNVYEAALDAIESVLGCDRASVLLFDEDEVMRFVAWRGLPEAYRRAVDGHSPWTCGQPDPEPIFVEDIAETDEARWLKDILAEHGIKALGFIPLVSQGATIGKFMTYHADRHAFSPGEREVATAIARQVGFSLERFRSEAARRAAEEDLRQSEQRFREMSEQAPVMIWMSDRTGHCLHLNAMLREFWNVAEEQVPDFDWSSAMHPDDAQRIGKAMGDAMAERREVHVEGRYLRNDGAYRVLMTHARPRFSGRRTFEGMTGVNVDITERKEAEEHRKLLIHELNHRVKNTLAVVQSLARLSLVGLEHDARFKSFRDRLAALAKAHDLIASGNWTEAPLADVARQTLIQNGDDSSRIAISGPPIMLTPKQAVSAALALNELYTNALKYGALSTGAGTIGLGWEVDEDLVALAWEEKGGPPVSKPERQGFGSTLISQTFTKDFEADVEMDFRPEGLVCRIRFPLSVLAPNPARWSVRE